MDATCCVSHCKSKNTKDITLFKFPRDESLRDKWAKKLKLDGGTNDYLYVCSIHFLPKDFYATSYSSNRLRLRRGVIPSVKIQNNPSPKHRSRRTLKFKDKIDDSKKEKIVKRLANHSPSINVTPAKESRSKLSKSLCAQDTEINKTNKGTKLSPKDANSSNTNTTIQRKQRQKSPSKNVTEVIDLISDKEDTESAPETNDYEENQRKTKNDFKGFEFVDVKKSLATTYELPLPPTLRPPRLKPNILRRPVETRSFQPKNFIEPINPGTNSSLSRIEATLQSQDDSEPTQFETSSSLFRNVKEQSSNSKTVGTQTMSITSANTIEENTSQQVSFVKVIEYLRKNLVGNTLKVNGSTFRIEECSITFKNKDKPDDVSMLVVDNDKLISSGTFLLSSLLEGCEFEGISKPAEKTQSTLKKDHPIENVQLLPKRYEITRTSEPAEQLQPSTKKDGLSKSQCVIPAEHCDIVMKDIPFTIKKKQTENKSEGLFVNNSLNNCLKDIFQREAKVVLNKLPDNLVRAIKNGDIVKVDTEEFIRKGVLYRRYIVKANPRLPPPSIQNMPLQVVPLITKSTPGTVSSNMSLFLNSSGQILRGIGAGIPQKDLPRLPLPHINITDDPLRTSMSKNDVPDVSLNTNIPTKDLPCVQLSASMPTKVIPLSTSTPNKSVPGISPSTSVPGIPPSTSAPNRSVPGIPASTSEPTRSVPGIPASTSEPNKSFLRRPVRILPKTSLVTSTPVICTTCLAILPSLAYLNEHKKIHMATKKNDSKSPVGSNKVNSKTELMVPQNQKKPALFIESDIAKSQSKALEEQKTLNENINNISIVEKQPITCTTDEEKHYVCDVCNKSFKFQYSLSYHKTLMHGGDFKFVPENIMENVPSNVEMCPECPQSFKTTEDFEKHLLDCHEIALKKSVYNCERCPKEFITFRSLGYHLEKVHNAIVNKNVLVKWKCRFCNKLFGVDYKFKTVHTKGCIMSMKKEKEEILKSSMNSKQSDSNHFHEELLESVNRDIEHDINNISANSDSNKRKYENTDRGEKRIKKEEDCNQLFQKLETLLGSIDGPNDITIVNMDEV